MRVADPLAMGDVVAELPPVDIMPSSSKAPATSVIPEAKREFEGEMSKTDGENNEVFVSLTYDALDAGIQMSRVKGPKAGAVVLFAGCTRDSFASKPVTHLSYSTYAPLALKTLSAIATSILTSHNLISIAITHRLGRVDIGDESILIAVASPHRQAAWKAGEECLEEVKKKVEIWKEEWFQDGGVWRSNRDGQEGVPVVPSPSVRRRSSARPGRKQSVTIQPRGATGNGFGSSPGDGVFMEGGLEI